MQEYTAGGMSRSRLPDRHDNILPQHAGGRRTIRDAVGKVPVLDLARLLCPDLRRVGREYGAQCPIHEDRTPSFRVNPDKGFWFCHGCGAGGDVVELYKLVNGHDRADVAAAELLMEFGYEPPKRPPTWFRKFERQRPIRDAIGRARFEHLRRRLFRLYFKPSVEAIEDEAEREEERRILWEATEPLARMVVREIAERRSA